MRWQDHAACRELSPDIFYVKAKAKVARAKAVCANCSVRVACGDKAFQAFDPMEEGVWGGFSQAERKKMELAVPSDTAIGRTAARLLSEQQEEMCRVQEVFFSGSDDWDWSLEVLFGDMPVVETNETETF